MSERRKKKKRKEEKGERNREKEHTGGLIYDASWITIKRYFTFLRDTPPSNWPPRGNTKTSRETREIIITEADSEREKERKSWLIRGGCLSTRSQRS